MRGQLASCKAPIKLKPITTMTTINTILASVNTCTFASIAYTAKVAIPQKYGLGKNVTELVECGVQLNYAYENAVNNRLKAQGLEPNFSAQRLPWGEWKEFNKVITHKGENYLRVYDYENRPYKVAFFVDGRKATAEETAIIKQWKASKRVPSGTQSAVGLTTHQVKPSAINFKGIVRLAVNGMVYQPTESEKVA